MTAVAIVVIVYPLLYVGMFAGDSMIHLVFGENAASGRFFEFNRGETSPGVTSPGYMLILGSLFGALPAASVPIAVKVINFVSWYALCLMVALTARRLLRGDRAISIAALIAGVIPGSAYNAVLGMENGLFGLLFVAVIFIIVRHRALSEPLRTPACLDLALGTLLGLCIWMRPEGVVVGGIWLLFRARCLALAGAGFRTVFRQLLAGAIPMTTAAVALIGFHYLMTGYLLPGSALARVWASSHGSLHLGPLHLDPGFCLRLAMYLPLTSLAVLGTIKTMRNTAEIPQSGELRFMAVIFAAFFVLYSTALGGAHLSRYVLFLMPLLVLLAGVGGEWLWTGWEQVVPKPLHNMRAPAFAAAAFALLAVFVVETRMRTKLGSHDGLRDAITAPSLRRERSENLLAQLGNPTRRPIVLATVEVQLRYRLDERFAIRSLDGRTDPRLLHYVHPDAVDHVGYIKERGVDFVLGFPDYNRRRDVFSLSELSGLSPGEARVVDGVRFTRLSQSVVAVTVLPP